MTKVDIFSGFLGAGKTTLIRKLIEEAYKGEQVVLIENEFGEIGIDGGFLQDAGVKINEMNSGCICCSLVGDFGKALEKVLEEYKPDRILIEPSGVGKLSDIITAVEGLELPDVCLNGFTTVVDAKKAKVYMKNFGEFYNNQVEHASSIILSHTKGMDEAKLEAVVALLKEHNDHATIITTDWDSLDGKQILLAMEKKDTIEDALAHLKEEYEAEECDDPDCCCHHHHDDDEEHEHHHHHHHHDHDEECDDPDCCCHHHHDDDEEHEHHHHHHHHDHDEECDDPDCCCHHHHDDDEEHEHHHHHHHHDHDEECDDPDCCCHHHHDDDEEHEHHHHHHDHDEECGCGHEHHHGHHHHHHADEVFDSIGIETSKKFDKAQIEACLEELADWARFGQVLRAKGIVEATDGTWIHFDYVPGEPDVRSGSAGVIGRLCIIGAKIDEHELRELFGIK